MNHDGINTHVPPLLSSPPDRRHQPLRELEQPSSPEQSLEGDTRAQAATATPAPTEKGGEQGVGGYNPCVEDAREPGFACSDSVTEDTVEEEASAADTSTPASSLLSNSAMKRRLNVLNMLIFCPGRSENVI